MKITIVGGGFTGLSAGLSLSQNHKVTLFEATGELGGLASAVKLPGTDWYVEKHYHHWFSNDYFALNLIKKLGLSEKLLFPKTLTSIYYQETSYPFNSPLQILFFSPLPFTDRLRLGLITLFLKLLSMNSGQNLEKHLAHEWLRKYFGEKVYEIVWKPLLFGKFGKFAKVVNMAWFWARIKKRTLVLGYLEGGYQTLIDAMEKQFKKDGGKILLSTPFDTKKTTDYDKIIITTPSPIFIKMYPQLPKDYKERLTNIPHLHALNLLLVTKEKILEKEYWLNINDRTFPFIAVIQQTNLVDAKHYGGKHLTWVGNYLPEGHPYLKMTKDELLKLYLPYLQKINPRLNSQFLILNSQLFMGPFAQPVFPTNYSKIKPDFITPIPNVYLANMDMVYPWDRGTNYAIELGQKVASLID
ncbi:NAD(P)/FAD-dependent oxidoreductase [Candidatus Gottesmanbacteria bacterium]|nr:NAD(P)/FAD-dependent oxidoreductase [Candidatus Gottesmanbacteria bacterium]